MRGSNMIQSGQASKETKERAVEEMSSKLSSKPCVRLFNVFNGIKYLLSALSLLVLLPISAFADHPKDDPFIKSLGVQFQDGQDAGDAVGSFMANLFWWGGLVVIALCIITAIGMIIHIMTMSKEEKEHSNTFMRWIVVIIAVVIAIALAGLLFSGLGKAAG